jgi:uncharacterized delta-60 repeat protein/CSLREA domain-containing protein
MQDAANNTTVAAFVAIATLAIAVALSFGLRAVGAAGGAGQTDTSFNGGTGVNGEVDAVAVQPDGKILIGGAFTTYNGDGAANDHIMRLNTDGTRDPSFNAGGTGVQGTSAPQVYAVALQSDGKILIGGDFSIYNGDVAASNNIMRLNTDGTRDTSFNAVGTGAGNIVFAVVVQPDGKILIGGRFSTYNGDMAANDCIMRLNADGTRDPSFNVGGSGAQQTNGAAEVDAVAVQPDGKILVGGFFTTYNGDLAASDHIMRLNADGTRDPSFNAGGSGVNDVCGCGEVQVEAVAVQADGKILIGGAFLSYNNNAAISKHIMRLNADGTRDTSFNTGGTGADSYVFAIALQPDEKIIIGGDFSYNGDFATNNSLTRLKVDGTRDPSFNPGGFGADNSVFTAALQPDGKIIIGGRFTSYNHNATARGIMRLFSNSTPVASATPNPAQTNEDSAVQITLTGTDADDDNLTFTITDAPDHGALGSVSAPNCSAANTCTATVTYTPNPDYNGPDSFNFKVNDGTADSVEATVQITVNALDDTSYVVTKTADTNDGACNADCSLREAITAANSDPGAETISFNITGAGCVSGVCTIAPTSALPTITGAVTIDGYTQPGASANTNATGALNTVLKIELNGQNAGFASGLNITAGGTTVRGLVINRFLAGVTLTGSGATGNFISGNFIGTNTAGTAALGNFVGVNITIGPTNNRVGTNGDGAGDAAERNLISGNTDGIFVNGVGTSGNVVAGNFIGTNAAGTAALANANGIIINAGAAGNRVGGSLTGEGNFIAFNTDDGIRVSDSGSMGNIVSANSIQSNGTTANHLGIDLGTDGVSANDADDTDTGPNNLQNFPVLSSAIKIGATTNVTGTLDSNAGATYRIEFFSNASCDSPNGNGEGRTFLGALTGVQPNQQFTFNTTTPVVGEFITATATNETTGDTSEFSACALVVNTAPVASATPNPAQTNEDTAVQITLTGTDADDDNLTFTITDAPDHGTLGSVSAPDCTATNTCTATVTYTPSGNYNGPDSFKFKVNDGTTDSAEATVDITVNAVDDTSFVVTKTADTNDGVCDADCSLREAITDANSDPGAETISFNVTGAGCVSGVCTIAPASALPTITGAVTIDGYTQPGASANTNAMGALNTVLKIELNGQNAGSATGLNIAGGTTVRGLAINSFSVGIQLNGAGASGNSISGNFIGTNAAGNAALANTRGILISNGATNNRIGTNGDGTGDEAERNLISGNSFGIQIAATGTSGNVVAGNFIGTNAAGTAALANGTGIRISAGATNNRVGGVLTGEGNTITFNMGDGVQIDTGTGNAIFANSIHSNGTTTNHLGIDLGTDGVNTNDAGDTDTGANNLQNFPVLSSAIKNGATTDVTGTLDSNADATYRIEFFSNASCDSPNGNGEGRTFLGALTGVQPNQQFTFNTTVPVSGGELITATATNETTNDTSEFSACAPLAPTAVSGTVTGRIIDANGLPVEGTVVKLEGTLTRKLITDTKGFYRFENVKTNSFYVLTPERPNYSFSPAQRSFSQLGNNTEAAFTAISAGEAANPLDTVEYFVRQQYVDILNREPDETGFNYWSDQILACGDDAACTRSQRTGVAAAFFIENEFQQSGAFIYDVYESALGRRPAYVEYSADRRQVAGGSTLETQKRLFTEAFVGRAEFVSRYANNATADSFVDALLANAQAAELNLSAQRDSLIGRYNSGASQTDSRALVLRDVSEYSAVRDAHYNAAFVEIEYFGYLHRNPDGQGREFWLNVLETGRNGDPGNYRGMVCSFITSAEYQHRFSTVVSHSNAECGNE